MPGVGGSGGKQGVTCLKMDHGNGSGGRGGTRAAGRAESLSGGPVRDRRGGCPGVVCILIAAFRKLLHWTRVWNPCHVGNDYMNKQGCDACSEYPEAHPGDAGDGCGLRGLSWVRDVPQGDLPLGGVQPCKD